MINNEVEVPVAIFEFLVRIVFISEFFFPKTAGAETLSELWFSGIITQRKAVCDTFTFHLQAG